MDFTGPGPLGGWMNSSSCASQPVTISGAKLGIALLWLCEGCDAITTMATMRLAEIPQRSLHSGFIGTKPFDQSHGRDLAVWSSVCRRLPLAQLTITAHDRSKLE